MYYMSFKCLYAHLCPSHYPIPPLGSSRGWGILRQSGSEQCFSNCTAFQSPGNRIKRHIQIPQCWDGALDPACLTSSQVRLILRGHVSSKIARAQSTDTKSQLAWVHSPALLLHSCTTLSKLLKLSGPLFPCLYIRAPTHRVAAED